MTLFQLQLPGSEPRCASGSPVPSVDDGGSKELGLGRGALEGLAEIMQLVVEGRVGELVGR